MYDPFLESLSQIEFKNWLLKVLTISQSYWFEFCIFYIRKYCVTQQRQKIPKWSKQAKILKIYAKIDLVQLEIVPGHFTENKLYQFTKKIR